MSLALAGLLAGCGGDAESPEASSTSGDVEGRPVFRFEVTVDDEQREITIDRVNGEVVTNEVVGRATAVRGVARRRTGRRSPGP